MMEDILADVPTEGETASLADDGGQEGAETPSESPTETKQEEEAP
jgi:hypothetical protein